jgi:hypothetical protein
VDPNKIPDPTKEYNWELVETVPGFQQLGIDACKGTADLVYRTPAVNTGSAPYNQKGYPGPYCDLWFFSASRTNYTSAGDWLDTEPAYIFDCFIDRGGFEYPPVGSNTNPDSLKEWLTLDSGIVGVGINGHDTGRGLPISQAPNDPDYNSKGKGPGAYYLWGTEQTAPYFENGALWPKEGGARIAGWLHRPALGSTADIVCRCQWQQPNRFEYYPWEGKRTTEDPQKQAEKLKKNWYGKDWHYTLEMMREIGTLGKIDPTEDALLGLFDPHPDE